MSNYGLDGLRHWLKSEYDLNGPYFADMEDLGHPDYLASGRLSILSRSLKYSYRASTPIPTTFEAIRVVKKNPVAYLMCQAPDSIFHFLR